MNGAAGRRGWSLAVVVAAALVPALVVLNIGLAEQNRGLQAEVNARQQTIQQAVQLDGLRRELIGAIARLAAQGDDPALRAILVEQGLSVAPAPGAPGAAPPGGGARP